MLTTILKHIQKINQRIRDDQKQLDAESASFNKEWNKWNPSTQTKKTPPPKKPR